MPWFVYSSVKASSKALHENKRPRAARNKKLERPTMKKIVLTLATLALAAASAAEKHTITLFQPSIIGGQELKAGEYRVEVRDNKMFVKNGKRTVEADVKVEAEASKIASTTVRYLGDKQVTEIRLGGTKTKLVLGSGAVSAN
jgi:hypothetical protein